MAHLVTPRPLAGAPTVHSLKWGLWLLNCTSVHLPSSIRYLPFMLFAFLLALSLHPCYNYPRPPLPPYSNGARRGETKKDQPFDRLRTPPRSRRGRPFDPSTGLRTGPSLRPFLSCPGRPGSIDYTNEPLSLSSRRAALCLRTVPSAAHLAGHSLSQTRRSRAGRLRLPPRLERRGDSGTAAGAQSGTCSGVSLLRGSLCSMIPTAYYHSAIDRTGQPGDPGRGAGFCNGVPWAGGLSRFG